MIIYVVTLDNKQNGERHLGRVAFTNEDDAFDYCWKKNREHLMSSYYYDYCAIELKGVSKEDGVV